MGVKFDKIQGKLREDDSQDLSPYQAKTDNTLETTNKTVAGAINELKEGIDSVLGTEEKIIIENTNSTIYVSNNARTVSSVDLYNCTDVTFNGVALTVGMSIAANTVYTVAATVSTDSAAIILKTLPQ